MGAGGYLHNSGALNKWKALSETFVRTLVPAVSHAVCLSALQIKAAAKCAEWGEGVGVGVGGGHFTLSRASRSSRSCTAISLMLGGTNRGGDETQDCNIAEWKIT